MYCIALCFAYSFGEGPCLSFTRSLSLSLINTCITIEEKIMLLCIVVVVNICCFCCCTVTSTVIDFECSSKVIIVNDYSKLQERTVRAFFSIWKSRRTGRSIYWRMDSNSIPYNSTVKIRFTRMIVRYCMYVPVRSLRSSVHCTRNILLLLQYYLSTMDKLLLIY